MTRQATANAVTVILHGYFSRRFRGSRRRFVLPPAEAATPRLALARLDVPAAAVGMVLVNKEQAGMDAALHAGDTLDVLPLLGGGAGSATNPSSPTVG